MSIYITGDTHGDLDVHKLNVKNFPDQESFTKDDFVVVCGDFGFVWKGEKKDYYWLDWLDGRNFTTLFVDGNHENFPLLYSYPVVDFMGGKAHKLRDSVYHLMRGQVFEICGKTIFTMGGATSQDKHHRKEGVSWWPEEIPSKEEFKEALATLDRVGWKVDYVVTHCAPDDVQYILAFWFVKDKMTNFLRSVRADLSYEKWFFGHYHVDIPVTEKDIAIYDKIIKISDS